MEAVCKEFDRRLQKEEKLWAEAEDQEPEAIETVEDLNERTEGRRRTRTSCCNRTAFLLVSEAEGGDKLPAEDQPASVTLQHLNIIPSNQICDSCDTIEHLWRSPAAVNLQPTSTAETD